MQLKLRESDIPAATEATLLHAAAFLEFKQHVARRCILAAAVLGRRQIYFCTPLCGEQSSSGTLAAWHTALCHHPKFGETTSHRQR